MARRPRIGITLEFIDPHLVPVERGLRTPLVDEGAIVIALPRDTRPEDVPELLEDLDGVLLSGGEDVDPARYGQERHPSVNTVPDAHDAFEISLARAALEQSVPILGICRGSQVLAVADGAALVQDIETQHPDPHGHRNDWDNLALLADGVHWHEIDVVPGSRLEEWLEGGPHRVNSFHHQAAAGTGDFLVPVATGPDGIIEASESPRDRPFAAGLQWHNELMWEHDPRYRRPFTALVEAARERAARR
jgi:putative glutamine amidotransferase